MNKLLTHAEVGRILNLPSRWNIDAFLKRAGADLHYDSADLQADLAILYRLRTNQPAQPPNHSACGRMISIEIVLDWIEAKGE